MDIFNMVVSEFYHRDSVFYATKARNVLATACSFVERNLSECYFGAYCRELKDNGTKNEKIWAGIKEKFPYISTKLSDDELYDLIINVYKPIRNYNMHSRIYYGKDKLEKIQFEFAKLPKYKFIELEGKKLANENNELTLYGCCAVIGLFLKGYQMKKFIKDLSTYYYKNRDNNKREYLFDMPNEYREKNKWDQIGERQKSQCFVKNDGKEKDIILFQEKYILSIVADFFLFFEDYIIKNGMVKQSKATYNDFSKLIKRLDIKEGLKKKINDVRKLWAHGNYFYDDYTVGNKNLMFQFIQMLNGLKKTQLAQTIENASKRISIEIIGKKYKQAIKETLELQKHYNDFVLLNKCIEKVNNVPIRHASVPIEVEQELAKLIDNKTVKISLDKVDDTKTEYEFSNIKIITHKCKDGFEVNGFKTQFTEITEYIVNEVKPLQITSNGKSRWKKRDIYKTPFMTQSEWWY